MDQHQHGGASVGRRLGVAAVCLGLLAGCLPTPSPDTSKNWPDPTTMAIYAVLPGADVTLGADGNPLAIRWNDVTLPDTTPSIMLTLQPTDANDPNVTLAVGIDAIPDGDADVFQFDGRDVDANLVPAGSYDVLYLIDDGEGGTDTALSAGTITVPLRFRQPLENKTIYVSSLESEGVVLSWQAATANVASRLDLGLVEDPNDPNGIQWASDPNGILVTAGDFSLTWQGTVFSGTTLKDTDIDPNGQPIEPNATYSVVARIVASGTGQVGYYLEAPGRLTILPDP